MRAVRGSAWRRPGHRGREKEAGGGQQGGRWRARVPASVGHTPVLLAEEEGDRGGPGGLGRPAAAGLRRGGEAQVSFSPLFCFSIFFLTFV